VSKGLRQGPVVVLAAVVLAALIVQVALAAGSSSGGPKATASGVAKAFKKYKRKTNRRIKALQEQLEALTRQPGPQGAQGIQGIQGIQGAQGPPGSAPACQGNGSGDTMVAAGAVCIDKFEASIWTAPEGGAQITGPIPCDANGQDCNNIFARSVPGVAPRADISWFQAQQALANVGKRLPSNAEWQQAVAGTPDPGAAPGAEDCNTNSAGPVATGSLANCISRFGANDMVGNVAEWVGDWLQRSTCSGSWGAFSDDLQGICGAATAGAPTALFRGGNFDAAALAGPFAVQGLGEVSTGAGDFLGFRGARE
jgi:hypothetical protein